MVNSGSFDSDGQGDRNAKVGFTQPHNASDSTQSSSPVTASVAAPCKTDFSQTADSDLPSVAHAIEPTPTKTEFNSDMPVENFTSLSSVDGVLEESEKPPVSEEKTSLCCSLPLDKVQGVLPPYHPPATKTDDEATKVKQPTRKLLCLYCDRSFVSSNLRQKHVERIHSVKQNRRVSSRRQNQLTVTPCIYCDRLNGTENTLKDLFQHLINEHSSKYFGCLPCEERFLTSSLLADHNATNHQATVLQPTQNVDPPPPGVYKTALIPPETDDLQEEEVEDIPVKITRSRMKPKPEEEPDKSKRPNISNKKKSSKLKEFRSKKLSVKSSRIALKRRESKRLQALAKLAESQKKKRPRPTEKRQSLNKPEQINSTKLTEKVKTNSTCINPYPEFDHFYRVKKITDHSIDNLKISSLTFDDVFDKAFFNRIKCNIEENLLHHIDGKLFKNEESESRISNFEKVSTVPQEIQNSNSENYGCELSLNAVTPVASLSLNSQFGEDFESQIEYGSKPSKKKTQPRKDEIHYKYFTRRKYQASILEHKENRDLSKLDMWTQLVIKKRQQKMLDDKKSAKEILEYTTCDEYKNKMRREELNRILDRRGPFEDLKEEASKKAALDKLNSVSEDSISEESFTEVREVLNEILNKVFAATEDVSIVVEVAEAKASTSSARKQDQREIPAYLNLRRSSSLPSEGEIDKSDKITLICSSQETENFELPTNQVRGKNELIELTGEWARCRMYICAACGAKLPNMKYLLEHKSLYHQNVWVQHYEFVGNQSELYRHLSIPALGKVGAVEDSVQCKLWKRSEARVCTKCGKQCNSLGELHRHILECGEDWTWMLARKKCKYRPFGAKSRRKRRGLIHRIHLKQKTEPTEKRTYKKAFDGPRQKPSDADTIQRMLANLPAKRSTRKLISLQDGIYRARKKTQINSINQKKVKCGKVIYKSSSRKETTEKTINTVSHLSGKGQKNNSSVTHRRSLRSLNKVLASRILDTNTKLSVKRKIKAFNERRRTRQSQIDQEDIKETVIEEIVKETPSVPSGRVKSKTPKEDDTDEEEAEPTPKRCSPRSIPRNVKKKMSMKNLLTGKISIKSFFPVKKKKTRKPLRENQNPQDEKLDVEVIDLKTRSKRKSKEVIEVAVEKKEIAVEKLEPKKTKNETFSSLVRSFSIHKRKTTKSVVQETENTKKQITNTKDTPKNQDVAVENGKNSDADKSSKKRKLKRSFRNVINRVKKLKIENSPESGVQELETKKNHKGGAFLEEGNPGGCPTPVQAEKIVIPSISEAKENIADISIPAPIVMDFQGPNENPPIPETIFKLESNNEKSLQAKGELDFDTLPVKTNTSEDNFTKESNTNTSIENNTAIEINPKTQPISIETSIKPKIVPLISPNMKGKIRKPARGLNDCIAMLTSKLQQKTVEEQTVKTIEEKPASCNLLSPNAIPEAHKEVPYPKPECILRIPTFRSQNIYPQVEETALDLSTKSVSTPDLSVNSKMCPLFKENQEEACRIQGILTTTSMEMLNTEKQISKVFNSVDRIIEDVVGDKIQTAFFATKYQNTWNSVDDTIQWVIDAKNPVIPKLPTRNTIDDIIDFVVECGNLKDISCKVNESKTVTEEKLAVTPAVTKSKERPARKIGAIRTTKNKKSVPINTETEDIDDNSSPRVVAAVPKEPNEHSPIETKVASQNSSEEKLRNKLTGSLKKRKNSKSVNSEGTEVKPKEGDEIINVSESTKNTEELSVNQLEIGVLESANDDLNEAFIDRTDSVIDKIPVKMKKGSRKVGQIRSKSQTKKVTQLENKTSERLLLETNLDNLLDVNEISSQPDNKPTSSVLQPTIFDDKESRMTKDKEIKQLCNEDEPHLLENKIMTTQQKRSILPSDSEDDIPLAALLTPDEVVDKADKNQPEENISDEEIPLIEIIKTKLANSGETAPKTEKNREHVKKTIENKIQTESHIELVNKKATAKKVTKRSKSPKKKVEENLQDESLTIKDVGDAYQVLETAKDIDETDIISNESNKKEQMNNIVDDSSNKKIEEKPSAAIQKLEVDFAIKTNLPESTNEFNKNLELDKTVSNPEVIGHVHSPSIFVEPIAARKPIKRRSRSLKTEDNIKQSLVIDEEITDNIDTGIIHDFEESLFESKSNKRRSRSLKGRIENTQNDSSLSEDKLVSDFLDIDSFTEKNSSYLVKPLGIKRPRGRPKKVKVIEDTDLEPSLSNSFTKEPSVEDSYNKMDSDMAIRPRGRPRKSKEFDETMLKPSMSSIEPLKEISTETCGNKMETDLVVRPRGRPKKNKEFDETVLESSVSSLSDSFENGISNESSNKKSESALMRPRGRPRKLKEFEDTSLESSLSSLSKDSSTDNTDKKIQSNLLTRPRGRPRKTKEFDEISLESGMSSLSDSLNKEISVESFEKKMESNPEVNIESTKTDAITTETDSLLTDSFVSDGDVLENCAEKANFELGFVEPDVGIITKLKKNSKKQADKSLNVLIAPSRFHPTLNKNDDLAEESTKDVENVLTTNVTNSKYDVAGFKDLNSSNITLPEAKELSEDLLECDAQNFLPVMSDEEATKAKKATKKSRVSRPKNLDAKHLLEDLDRNITATEVISDGIDVSFKNPTVKIRKSTSKSRKSKLVINKKDIVENNLQITDGEVEERRARNIIGIIEKTLSDIAALESPCKRVNRKSKSLNNSDETLNSADIETDITDISKKVDGLIEESILDTVVKRGRKGKLQTKPKNKFAHDDLSKMESTVENINVLTEASTINDNRSDNIVSKASLIERNDSNFDNIIKSKSKQRSVKNRRKIKNKGKKIILPQNNKDQIELDESLVENRSSNENNLNSIVAAPIPTMDEIISKDKELKDLQYLQTNLDANAAIDTNRNQEPPIKIVINKQKTRRKSKSFKKVDLKGQNNLFQDFSLVIKKSKRIAPIITYTPADTFSNDIYPGFIEKPPNPEQVAHTEPVSEDIVDEIEQDLDVSIEEMDMELDEIPITTSIIERDSLSFTNTLPAPIAIAENVNTYENEKPNMEETATNIKKDVPVERLFQLLPEKELPPATEEEVFLYETNKRSSQNENNADILSSVQEVEISNRKSRVKSKNKLSLDNSYEISEDINNFGFISVQINTQVYQNSIEEGLLHDSEKPDKTVETMSNVFDLVSNIGKEEIETDTFKDMPTSTKKSKKSKLVNRNLEEANDFDDFFPGANKAGEKEIATSNKKSKKSKINKKNFEEPIIFNLKGKGEETDALVEKVSTKGKCSKNLEEAHAFASSIDKMEENEASTFVKTTTSSPKMQEANVFDFSANEEEEISTFNKKTKKAKINKKNLVEPILFNLTSTVSKWEENETDTLTHKKSQKAKCEKNLEEAHTLDFSIVEKEGKETNTLVETTTSSLEMQEANVLDLNASANKEEEKETSTSNKKLKKSKINNKNLEEPIINLTSTLNKLEEEISTSNKKVKKSKIVKKNLEEPILFSVTSTIRKGKEKETDILMDPKSEKANCDENLQETPALVSSIAETEEKETNTLVETVSNKKTKKSKSYNKNLDKTHCDSVSEAAQDILPEITSRDPPVIENKTKRGRKKKAKPNIPDIEPVEESVDKNAMPLVPFDSILDKEKDIDNIYAFTESEDLEIEKPIEKPKRSSRKQTKSFSEGASKFDDDTLTKNAPDICDDDKNRLQPEMTPNIDAIIDDVIATPVTKKRSRSGRDLSNSNLEGKDQNPGEIKENDIGIDMQENGRRKSVRSAKVKALEHIHDDALAELTDSERNRDLDKGSIVVSEDNITPLEELTKKRASRRQSRAQKVSNFVENSDLPKDCEEKSELPAELINDLEELNKEMIGNDKPEENVDTLDGPVNKKCSKKTNKASKIPKLLDNLDVSKDSLEKALEELNNIDGLEELENSIEKELNAIDDKKKTKQPKNKLLKEIEVSKEMLSDSNLEDNIQLNLTADEHNQELRRSRRGSRKIASYNENDLIDPLLDEIDGKRKNRKKDKTDAIEPVVPLTENKLPAKEPQKKLNSDELFDLLKASSKENIGVPKPQNSFLNNLEESSLKEFNDDNFDNVFEDILEKSTFLIQNNLMDKSKEKDIDKIYEFTESPESIEPILPLDSKRANKKLPKRNLSPSKPPIEETSESMSIAPDSTFSVPTTPDISELSRDSKSKSTKNDKTTPSDKPNYCEICNKSFIRLENLVKHKRTLTHIQKLSEIEAKEAAEKSKSEQNDSKTSDSIIEISPDSTKIISDMSKNDINISDILQDSNKPTGQNSPMIHSSFSNNHSLKLADIINDVLNKPVLEGDNEKRNSFSDIIMHKPDSQPEYRRYKSLGERKSFDSEPIEPQPIVLEEPYVSKTTILEKQISLLENIIENQAGVNYIDDISMSSNNSLENNVLENNLGGCSPSELSLKQDDSSNVTYGRNNLLKPSTNDDSFLKPSQYEEISEDSINLRNYEDQKLRKTLNRDEELFLECCSLLKSGSEVSSYSNKKSHNKVLGTMGLKQCDEPEWLERKSLVQKPLYDTGNDYSDDNSRIPTPLGDSYDDDASNSNTITSNWNINRKVPVFEHITPEKRDSGNNSFSFEEVLNEYDAKQKKDKIKGGLSKFGSVLTKTISNQVKALPKIISRKDLGDDINREEASEKKQEELSDGSTSDSKKMITKGARKVFEGLKVSIPTEELNLEEVLNCSPKSKKMDIVNIQNTADSAKVTQEVPSPAKPARTARKSKPVKNKSQFGSNLLFKMNKKKVLSPTTDKKKDDDVKTHDIYDFEETQDNTDVFTKPDFRTFRSMKCNEPLPEPESDTESRDYVDSFGIEAKSITSSISSSSSKKPKTQENITKKKCMIMGRIFKNAAKSKIEDIDEEIRDIPELDNSELVESYVAECTKVIKNVEVVKPKLSEREINQLFDQLLENKLENCEANTDPKPAVKKPEVKKPDMKKKVKPKNRKRVRTNSDSTDDEFNLNKTIKKRAYRKNGKAEDNCINLEQELKECIGVASRKSQRKCTSGKQNVLVEYWSSDDSQFEALLESQRIEVKQVGEPIKETKNITESEIIPYIPEDVPKEVEPVVEDPKSLLPESSEKQHKPKNPEKRPQQKRKPSSDKKPKPTNASNGKTIDTVTSNRRKRAAANPLYHWSSSSEDESQDLIEVKPIRDEVEDDEDRPVQHGWIVGDSPKKLVTMLAQAKGKKTDIDCVKEQGKKRTNAVS